MTLDICYRILGAYKIVKVRKTPCLYRNDPYDNFNRNVHTYFRI